MLLENSVRWLLTNQISRSMKKRSLSSTSILATTRKFIWKRKSLPGQRHLTMENCHDKSISIHHRRATEPPASSRGRRTQLVRGGSCRRHTGRGTHDNQRFSQRTVIWHKGACGLYR